MRRESGSLCAACNKRKAEGAVFTKAALNFDGFYLDPGVSVSILREDMSLCP